jgi:hypothetical protein
MVREKPLDLPQSVREMIKALLTFMFFAAVGCHSRAVSDEAANELANKPDYSILQAYEYDYREVKNDKPYLIFRNALKTGATVVAFPIKNRSTGYVVILAETKHTPKVKAMPQLDFVVTQDAFADVRTAAPLSREVEEFIAQHVR